MSYRKLGLIGAMAEEVQFFQQHMAGWKETPRAGISFGEGTFQGQPAVVCKSGVGKVNAAVCTQILIDVFGVDGIVFTGVAGALDPTLDIGDLVISTECLQHDMDVTALGFPRGVIPYQDSSVFAADARLADLAAAASESLFPGRTRRGRVLSGDQFVAERGKVAELREQLGGACTEMEGAAVAQVCAMNGVPFVVIRSMSDKADGSAPDNFPAFMRQAAEHSYRIVEELVKRLNAR